MDPLLNTQINPIGEGLLYIAAATNYQGQTHIMQMYKSTHKHDQSMDLQAPLLFHYLQCVCVSG